MFRLLSVFFLIVVVLGIMLIFLLCWASSRYIKTESVVFQHGASEYSVSDTLSIITFNAAYFKGAFNPFPGSRFSEHFGSMASGQGLLSRYPITTNQRIVLPKADSLIGVNSSFLAQMAAGQLYTRRIAQVSSIRLGSQDLVVINVHLENSNATSRMRQMKKVIEQYQLINPSLPVIILGDFNTIVPQIESISLTDRERSWFQNDQTLDMLAAESLKSLSFTSKDCSFPSTQPRLRFDHIFFNQWIEPIEEKVIYHSTASDHLPVWFRFKIRKP